MDLGYELRGAGDGKGDGVFATRNFQPGETVLVGVIERRLPANHSHATQVSQSDYVLLGGLAPMVNHSCEPNCGIRLNKSGAPDLVARQEIVPGDEINFDYAMRNYSVEYFDASCQCGAAYCRSSVTGWKDLPDERRTAYRGLVAPYLIEADGDLARDRPETTPRRGERKRQEVSVGHSR